MMEKEKLRRADLFSGTLIVLFGLLVVLQALQMPMKDSYGGVQNVWYVSPALFPLFVGCMLVLLGAMLVRTALREVGLSGVADTVKYLFSSDFGMFLRKLETIRFYGIVLLLASFVFIMVPRVDFFLSASLFLLAFFSMYYLEKEKLLLKLMVGYLAGSLLFLLVAAIQPLLAKAFYPLDWFVLVFTVIFALTVRRLIAGDAHLRKKFRIALVLAITGPLTVGMIFKYFLLVPMPFEGMVVALLDAVWYADIWG